MEETKPELKRIDYRKQISSPFILTVIKELSEFHNEGVRQSVYRLLEMGASSYIKIKREK